VDDLVGDAAGETAFSTTPDEWVPSDSEGDINLSLNQGQSFIGSSTITNTAPPPPVPEPASLALLSVGVMGLAAARRKLRR